MSGGEDFDWGADNANVVLRAYGSVAVHENPYGDVVIRQERDAMQEDDQWVVVPIQDAEHVAKAILDKAREIKEGWADTAQPARPAQPAKAKAEQTPPPLALPGPVPKLHEVKLPLNGGGRKAAGGA